MHNTTEIYDAATRLSPAHGGPSRAPRVPSPGAPAAVVGGRERRAADRREFDVTVDFQSDHNFYTGFTENISSGGLFIATRDILPIGSRFQVAFGLSTHEEPILTECEVRWQRLEQLDNPESVPGMGVRFLGVSRPAQEAINSFLRQRDSLFYDDED